MIRAAFFDLYNTLVRFEPPRQVLQALGCAEFGIHIEPEAIRRSYWVADDFMSLENARFSIQQRSAEERRQFWAEYEATLLRAAGAEVSTELAGQVFTRIRQIDRRLVLFDDVLPTLDAVKSRGLVLGLLSNLDQGVEELCRELGLDRYLDFCLVSLEVGAEKPHPPIFLTALERAAVDASEALHVGDQYHSDVVGARGVGISPLLLDREDVLEHINDCPRITSLAQVLDYI